MRSFETVRIAHPPKMRATARVPDAEMAITVFACKRAMRIQTGEAAFSARNGTGGRDAAGAYEGN
jgi:hypothetical protein